MPEKLRLMLLEAFAEESSVLLHRLAEEVDAWHGGTRERKACLHHIKRHLHTLRGAADTVGLDDVSTICCALDEYIETTLFSGEALDDNSITPLSHALQVIDARCAGQNTVETSSVLHSLHRKRSGEHDRSGRDRAGPFGRHDVPFVATHPSPCPEPLAIQVDSSTRMAEALEASSRERQGPNARAIATPGEHDGVVPRHRERTHLMSFFSAVAQVHRGFLQLQASFRQASASLQSSHSHCFDKDPLVSARLSSLGASFDALGHDIAQLGRMAEALRFAMRQTEDRVGPGPLLARDARSPGRVVLVADDSASVRRMVRKPLEAAGHVVYEAVDGREALELVTSITTIDLLVTDLAMPYLDGTALCREVRDREMDLPIIVISAIADDHTLVSTLDAGADMFIVKRDFNPHRFMRAVKRLLPD